MERRGTPDHLDNQVTLEHEIFAAGNEELLKRVFLSLHPRSQIRWTTAVDSVVAVERPTAFVRLLADMEVRKGDFAQQLSEFIEHGARFVVPTYLRDAIRSASAT